MSTVDPNLVGFPGAEKTEPHFAMSDPLHVTGFTLYFNGGAAQLAVLEVKKSVERGTHITVVAKNISDMTARDFVLAGAVVNLIDFDTKPIRAFNLMSDGINVHAFFRDHTGYSARIQDLKLEGKAVWKRAREKMQAVKKAGGDIRTVRWGSVTAYVLGDFGPACVARANSKGRPYKKGHSKRDDVTGAGGQAVDLKESMKRGHGPSIESYASGG